MRILVLTIVLIIIKSVSYSQTSSLGSLKSSTFTSADHVVDMLKDDSGNVYIHAIRCQGGDCYSSISKINSSRNIVWNRQLSELDENIIGGFFGFQIINGYIYSASPQFGLTSGYSYQIWKHDMNGGLIHSKKIPCGTAPGTFQRASLKSWSNGYCLSFGLDNGIRITSFDLNDNLLWSTSINSLNIQVHDIETTSNGGVLFVGRVGGKGLIGSIANNGDLLFVKQILYPAINGPIPFTIDRINSNKYLISGAESLASDTTQGILAFIDSLGTIYNYSAIDVAGWFKVSTVLSNGNFLLYGPYRVPGLGALEHYFEVDHNLNLIASNRKSAALYPPDYFMSFVETDSMIVFTNDTTLHFTSSFYNPCDPLWSLNCHLDTLPSLVTIPFVDFSLTYEDSIYDAPEPLSSSTILSIIELCNEPISVENFYSSYVKIFPSPFHDQINIISDYSIAAIKLYSTDLKEVEYNRISLHENEVVLLLGEIPSGVYLLEIFTEGEWTFRKIVKI